MSRADAGSSDSLPLTLRRLVDEACDRFEAAWRSGQRPCIEAYLAEGPHENRTALLHELLALEIELRSKSGEAPAPGDYEARFPEHVKLVQNVFGGVVTGDPTARPQPEALSDKRTDSLPESDESTPNGDAPVEAAQPPPLPDRIGRYKAPTP